MANHRAALPAISRNQPGHLRHRRDGRQANPPALPKPMRADPSRDGLDFVTLEDPRPRPFLVILDADKLEIFSGWLSLVIACALNALFRRGGKGQSPLFALSGFAQFGHLKPITTGGQGRRYDVALFLVSAL